MDEEQLEAVLSAGWHALDAGKLEEARAQAAAVLADDPESPEGYTLSGAVASADGDAEKALTAFERAMALDAQYVEPRLLAAEVCALEGDAPRALELCDEALDLAEEESDYLDALLLKAEVELGEEDPDAAAATLAELPPVELPDPAHHLRAGECFLEIEDVDNAEHHFSTAARLEPQLADALYGLGLCAEARGDDDAQRAQFRQVAALDRQAPRPAWAVSVERLEQLVEAALGELPERARKLLDNVPILVEDYPADELIDDGLDPRLYGLFAGVPLPEQSSLGAPPQLSRVILFQRNIERHARTAAEVEEQIRITLLHETGHFFGMSEEELADVGLD
jgi:predicted Zn-dependent protease with MMP-like domain/Flp pilus assembly protein TadD